MPLFEMKFHSFITPLRIKVLLLTHMVRTSISLQIIFLNSESPEVRILQNITHGLWGAH
jgi:hypothetical protein